MSVRAAIHRPTFALPAGREAAAPPERRGTARDGVRLLVAGAGRVSHHVFRELPHLLAPGDLVVVNTSATLPAALDAVRASGERTTLHVATQLDDGSWVIELRRSDGRGPMLDGRVGERVAVPSDVSLELIAPYPDDTFASARLWRARPEPATSATPYLLSQGRPITYGHNTAPIVLDDLQNVYAREPGSAEMASAGRPFTGDVIVDLVARGIAVAPVLLHAGVSSPELHEPPTPEWFEVPQATARLVNVVRRAGGRVVAVGTTVTRALETAASADGEVMACRGWTELVLGPDRPARVVDGLVTGLHLPEASHLLLLEAVAGPELVQRAYDEAVRGEYLWHEFGDSMLFLPERRRAIGRGTAERRVGPGQSRPMAAQVCSISARL